MAKRVCPKCAEFVDKKLKVCPFCGEVFQPKNEPVVIKEDNFENNLVLAEEIQPESGEEALKQEPEQAPHKKRHAHKKKKTIEVDVKKDDNGELEIETDDVTFFDEPVDRYRESSRGNAEIFGSLRHGSGFIGTDSRKRMHFGNRQV